MIQTGRQSRGEGRLGHHPSQMKINGSWNAGKIICGIGDIYGRDEVE